MRRRELLLMGGLAAAGLTGCASARRPDPGHVTNGVAPGLEEVREVFLRVHAQDPGGAQLAAYRQGRRIVDLWTGVDPIKNRPFDGERVTTVMSCTKGWTAIVVHDLAQRGIIDIDAPVARYWPEFAVNGKADITIAWLLSHRAGLPNFPPEARISWPEMADWDRCVRVLEQMTPAWTPGAAVLYHAVTFGFLLGEVVRRASGRTVGQIIAEDYARPLDLDLWIGNLPLEAEARYAPQFTLPLDGPKTSVEFLNTRAAHLSEQPAANGIANARSMAKLYAAAMGELDGLRILSDETITRAAEDATRGLDAPDGTPRTARYGLGFNVWAPGGLPMLGPGAFGHGGAGGRLGFAYPAAGVAVGYVCTHRGWIAAAGPDPRWACIDALGRALGT